MPYYQVFDLGIGIHGGDIRGSSHGCIRVSEKDAEELWALLDEGTLVEVQPSGAKGSAIKSPKPGAARVSVTPAAKGEVCVDGKCAARKVMDVAKSTTPSLSRMRVKPPEGQKKSTRVSPCPKDGVARMTSR